MVGGDFMTAGRLFFLITALVLVLGTLLSVGSLFEYLSADEILVVQAPWSGVLSFYDTPGVKPQIFGSVTHYKKRSQYWFSAKSDQGSSGDESLKIRFNDGGHATISGSLAWEMPLDADHLRLIHTKYGSQHAVEQQLIRTDVEKAVYMTGPLMSSKESYADRRNDLLQYIEDQLQHGIYHTETVAEKTTDLMTGQPKTVNVVKLVMMGNKAQRTEQSPLEEFGIKVYNLSINEIKYDPTVEAQIQSQQRAVMDVQTAMAEAVKAQQKAITVAKEGEANAARAKWEQEVDKARAVTKAEQEKEVARLHAEAAELTKKEQILLGEGESRRRQLVMEADGALDKKLAAYVSVQKAYADAISNYGGAWVPSVVWGGAGGSGAVPGGGAMQMIELLGIKAAKDLAIDLEASGVRNTKRK